MHSVVLSHQACSCRLSALRLRFGIDLAIDVVSKVCMGDMSSMLFLYTSVLQCCKALSKLPFSRQDVRHEQLEVSLAPDDVKDVLPRDRQTSSEYRFDACVWDSCVLVGLGILSWQESLAVAFCGLWSILVEGFFVLILYDNMTETVFEPSLAQEMKDWRIHFGSVPNRF